MIEKAICVWYVLVSSSCSRCAFFATSIFEIRNRKFVVFQYVNKRVCPLPGNFFVVHGDVSRRMICWKKTFANSLVEATASENVCEKSVIASKQKRTMVCGGNLNILQTSALGIIRFYTSHTTLGLRPRVVCSVCNTR